MKFIINIEPKPQSRPRFARRGSYIATYEDAEMKKWREKCKNRLKRLAPSWYPLDGALKVELAFYIKPPLYISKLRKNREALEAENMPVAKKPDIDNYIKAVLDSANDIFYNDDGQIAEINAKKMYSSIPRIEIAIDRL